MGPTQQYGPWIYLIYIKLPIDLDSCGPVYNRFRSMPFKGLGVSRAPLPPTALNMYQHRKCADLPDS